MCETFCKNLQFSSISLSEDRLELAGPNLDRVFNWVWVCTLMLYITLTTTKQPILKLKTRPNPLGRSLPFAFVLAGQIVGIGCLRQMPSFSSRRRCRRRNLTDVKMARRTGPGAIYLKKTWCHGGLGAATIPPTSWSRKNVGELSNIIGRSVFSIRLIAACQFV